MHYKISISRSCTYLGRSRSGYYKSKEVSQKRKESNDMVLEKVKRIRHTLPNIGCRKLHYLLRKELLESGLDTIGRDRLFHLLREKNMLIKRKRKYAVTTDSNHPFRKYSNLIKDRPITRKNQVWISDITYIKLETGFCYLSLITDLYTRKIVGHCTHDTLELLGCSMALDKALKSGRPDTHHSDRGSQYCSRVYTEKLKNKGSKISMTEGGNCYENAHAERINGILKTEFNLDQTFKNIKQARSVINQAIENYNNIRPHWSLNLKTPNEMYIAA